MEGGNLGKCLEAAGVVIADSACCRTRDPSVGRLAVDSNKFNGSIQSLDKSKGMD